MNLSASLQKLLILWAVLACNISFAQISLNPGDIAITGYQATTSSDTFCFVVLRPTGLPSGTTINFTDNGWNNANSGNTNEGIVLWTAGQDLSYGQQVVMWLGSAKGSFQGTVANVSGTMSLAAAGDQIIAFQGTWSNSPTIITGLHYHSTTQTTTESWDGSLAATDSTPTSIYPPLPANYGIWVHDPSTSLTTKTTNAYYDGELFSNPDTMRKRVNTVENWVFSSITTGDPGWRLPPPMVAANDDFIEIVSLSASQLCAGQDLTVKFEKQATFQSGNQFEIWLENYAETLVLIGNAQADSATVTLPDSLLSGNYQVKIKSTSPVLTSANSLTLTVNALPKLTWESPINLCSNSPAIVLDMAHPTGGNYKGSGVSNNFFDPSQVIAGNHIVTYTLVDENFCSASISQTITVFAAPTVLLPAFQAICANNDSLALSTGTPTGGNYSGAAVTNGWFKTDVAAIGSNDIFYFYIDSNNCQNSATSSIIVNPKPVVGFETPAPICLGDSLTLTAGNPAGGVYSGENVANQKFYSASAGVGNHEIVYAYTDENGCSNKAKANQQVHPIPILEGVSSIKYCANDAAVALGIVSPSGGNYSGIGVANDSLFPALFPVGAYTILYSYTNEYNCSANKELALTILPVTQPKITSAAGWQMCPGATVCLQADSCLSYQWLNCGQSVAGAFTRNFNTTEPGWFSVAVQDINGCTTSSDSVFVSLFENPQPTIEWQAAPNLCVAGTEEIWVNQIFNAYRWWLNDSLLSNCQNRLLSLHASGNYLVEVTDSNGCKGSSAPVSLSIVSPVVVNADKNSTICQGDSLQLSASLGQHFDWYSGGELISSAENKTIQISQAGEYWVTATDENGCTATSEPFSVVVNPLPLPQINLSGNDTLCAGASNQLETGNFDKYRWYHDGHKITGANYKMYQNSLGGNFQVLVTDSNGCSSFSTGIAVTLISLPKPELNYPGAQFLCTGDSLLLQCSNCETVAVQWLYNDTLTENTTETLWAKKAGNYKLKLSVESTCEEISKPSVLIALTQPDKPTITFENEKLISSVSNNIQWLLNDEEIPGATQTQLEIYENGWYSVRADQQNGCSNFSEPLLVGNAGIEDKNGEAEFAVFPNPTSGNFNIHVNASGTFVLINALGVEICSGKLIRGDNQVPVVNIGEGYYQLLIELKLGNILRKSIQILK